MSGQTRDRVVAPPPIAANLRDAQERAGLTNAELAATLHVGERQITRWRGGTTTPTWPWLVALARVLGHDPAWFYAEHSDEADPLPEVAA